MNGDNGELSHRGLFLDMAQFIAFSIPYSTFGQFCQFIFRRICQTL